MSSSRAQPGVWNAANGPRVLTEAQRQRKRERDRNSKREEKLKQQQRMQELEEAKNSASKRVQELEAQLENCCCKRGGATRLDMRRCQSSVHIPTVHNALPPSNYSDPTTYHPSNLSPDYAYLSNANFEKSGPGAIPWGDKEANLYQESLTSPGCATEGSAASYCGSYSNYQADPHPDSRQTSFEDPEPRVAPYNINYSGVSSPDQPCFSPASNNVGCYLGFSIPINRVS
ncbi:uncharacterized protein BP5553_08336 [Venustampulla echinocandica]|uniref:BZIP domain-containing protein n=1 Tax=Venustampulla echinocandica TaxID=2656787 RepID=A0A370TGD7_9HELO|nr:uncharacterized protein BP5553_08336 [Venustampulla echinocandica]RDL33968.1 hypothetical protein BP5553_08336 [Venustampulla echinocandica]